MTQATNEQLYQLRTETISAGVGSTTTNFIASARGAMMWDVEGREYIDFAGGIGVMNIGHCHPKVVAAIKEQAEKLKARFEKWQQQFDIIGGIRGLGAMLGLELVKGANREPAADEAKQLTGFCLEKGLLLLSCGSYGNVIRVLAPFVITDEQLEKGLDIMEEGLAALT